MLGARVGDDIINVTPIHAGFDDGQFDIFIYAYL